MNSISEKIAIFPGSFDPLTLGHVDIIKRSIDLFDKVVIGIGNNAEKKYMFSLEDRIKKIESCFKEESRVSVIAYDGLTVDFAKKIRATYIIRGIRNSQDFEFEKSIAQMNAIMNPGVETVILFTDPRYASISSTIVRDILKNGGDVSPFIPA